MSTSRIIIHPFVSKVLEGNFLHDPTTRRVVVYLPPGYDETRRYPVVFILVGFTGRGTMMLNESAWDENIQERLDRLITSRQIRPLIAVLPDCFTRYGGSQYINSVGTGRYMDHVVDELVPWVDTTFRTIPQREFRAVIGKSSGGFGALTLAMRRPHVFGLAGSHSGDMYFDFCYQGDFPACLRGLARYGGVEKFIHSFRQIRPRNGDFFAVLNTIAMASCYSPNVESPWGFDLPFDVETGEWHDAVWARWKAWDPIELVSEYADALRSLRWLYLDCGTRDEYNLQYGARTFAARLKRAGIAYHYEEYDDGHRDVQYRYDVSLKALSEVWEKSA